jgi:hypothetical protein
MAITYLPYLLLLALVLVFAGCAWGGVTGRIYFWREPFRSVSRTVLLESPGTTGCFPTCISISSGGKLSLNLAIPHNGGAIPSEGKTFWLSALPIMERNSRAVSRVFSNALLETSTLMPTPEQPSIMSGMGGQFGHSEGTHLFSVSNTLRACAARPISLLLKNISCPRSGLQMDILNLCPANCFSVLLKRSRLEYRSLSRGPSQSSPFSNSMRASISRSVRVRRTAASASKSSPCFTASVARLNASSARSFASRARSVTTCSSSSLMVCRRPEKTNTPASPTNSPMRLITATTYLPTPLIGVADYPEIYLEMV